VRPHHFAFIILQHCLCCSKKRHSWDRLYSNRASDDSFKLLRSGMDLAGDYHAAPMGLKTVLFRRLAINMALLRSWPLSSPRSRPTAGLVVVRYQFGILTVETDSPAAPTGHL
jgi:hypothetical protein